MFICVNSYSQIRKSNNAIKLYAELGYNFNNLNVLALKPVKNWLKQQNTYFFGASLTKPINHHLSTKLYLRNYRFIYLQETITLPINQEITKTDFLQLSPVIQASILRKYKIEIGPSFNIFIRDISQFKNSTTNKISPISKPIFQTIYYSTKTTKIMYGINYGFNYSVNKFTLNINGLIPLNPASSYEIQNPTTMIGNSNNLRFYYSNINLGISYNFLSLPRNQQKPTNYQ